MARGQLFINGAEKIFNRLSLDRYVKSIPTWNVDLLEIDETITGFQICNILRDGEEIFRGYVTQPEKSISPQGQDMPIGGLEWTGRLKFALTPHSSMTETTVSTALTTILQNSPYGLGTVDSFEFMADPFIWDTTLEFLEFTWTDLCIVYATTAEVQSEISTDNLELPPPSRRGCFWYDGATKRFYVIAYNLARGGGAALQYNFTADGSTWNGWADFAGVGPGVGAGAAGAYGIYWDSPDLIIIIDDGAGNVDHYTGAVNDGTGVITTALTAGNFDVANLELGPIVDSQGDPWCCVDDGANYRFFEWSGAAWIGRFNSNDIPKAMFRGDIATNITVIEWDQVAQDVEEWLFETAPVQYTFQRKVADIDHNSMGYACGYRNPNSNLYLYWEDVYAAGDADIEYSERPPVYENDADVKTTIAWIAKEAAVDDDQYQNPGNFSVSGDGAGNTYLFYQYQSAVAGPNLHVIRRLEGSFGSSVELAEQINDTGIDSPETNVALFVIWLDLGLDGQFILLAPYGITAERDYFDPYFHESFEGTLQFDGSGTPDGTIDPNNTSYPFSCTENVKFTLAQWTNEGHCYYYESLGGAWGDEIYLAARNVRWTNNMDNNAEFTRIMQAGEGIGTGGIVYFGVARNGGLDQWYCYYRNDLGGGEIFFDHLSGVAANPNTTYHIEGAVYRDGANGFVKFWVNGVQVINLTGLNNNDRTIRYAHFGFLFSDGVDSAEQTLYMDDCRISTNRIGDYVSGTVRTDLYTASGGFLCWGTLSSPDDDDCNTLWSIYDDIGPTLQLSGLTTSVDLDSAGLSSAITDIYVQASYTHRYLSWRYIYTIQISERVEDIDLDTDYENCYVGVNKLAGFLSSEYRLRWDDTLDFVASLGEDKSDRIILKTAKSLSVRPDIKPNIEIIRRAPDFQAFANAIKLLGAGDWPDRIEAEAQDTDSQAEYGVTVWKRVVNKDAVTEGMAQTAAQTEVDNSKNPIERISVNFLDEYDTGEIEEGVTVYLADENTGLLNTARIVRLSREYDGAGNEFVSAELTARLRGAEYVNQFLKTYDLERWI